MSTWKETKKEDLSVNLEGKEIDIWLEQDNQGNVYTSIKTEDLIEFLKENKLI